MKRDLGRPVMQDSGRSVKQCALVEATLEITSASGFDSRRSHNIEVSR